MEAHYRHSIDIARNQQSRALELRAVTSLAKLYGQQNRHDEAREILSATLEKFTEGFDTPDFRDARALLSGH